MFSQAGLDAIEEAIAGGYLRVKYDDKEVWYRDMNELLKARELIRRRIGQGTVSRKYVSFKRDT
tara:strand:- start:35674 stop:35865 length:192 start_codon:yes stop_codon:yes gene_type:complete